MQQSVEPPERYEHHKRRHRKRRRASGARRLLAAAMIGASLLGGMLGSLLMGRRVDAQVPDVVTTTQVNLVDGAGNLRGVLAGSDQAGRASLALFDGAGSVRSLVAVQADGTPVLELHGPGGETRLLASVQGEDTVLIVGEEGAGQGMIGDVQGRPILALSEGGRSRLLLHLNSEGWPGLALSDGAGNEAASLSVSDGNRPELRLNTEGRQRALLTVAQGATVLNLSDAARVRMVVGVAPDGNSSVTFLDAAGGVTARLPQGPQ